MSKNEKIKEQLGWLKVSFGLLVAMTASLIGWMASNYDTADPFGGIMMIWTVIFSAFLFAGVMIYVIYAFSNHKKKTNL